MFDGNFRAAVDKVTTPIGVVLQKGGASPDAVTVAGLVMAAGCAVAIGTGQFTVAVLLLALCGFSDALDGAVANAAGRAGPRGAFLDSVSDRLSDGLLFAGAGWYFASGESPLLVMLPFALYISASLVSYQRAKAESLGFVAKGGLMERAERFVALGFGLLFSDLFVITLWVMLALTVATAIYRFGKVWQQADAVQPRPNRNGSRVSRRRNRRVAKDLPTRFRTRAESRRSGRL